MGWRRKQQDGDPARSLADWRFADGVGVAVFVVLIAGAVAFLTFMRLRPQPSSYEGRIVDKSITLSESQKGSGRVLRLHVRGRDGGNFAVKVDYDTYNRAQVGMWVRNDGGGPQLSWEEPPPSGVSNKAEGAGPPPASAPR